MVPPRFSDYFSYKKYYAVTHSLWCRLDFESASSSKSESLSARAPSLIARAAHARRTARRSGRSRAHASFPSSPRGGAVFTAERGQRARAEGPEGSRWNPRRASYPVRRPRRRRRSRAAFEGGRRRRRRRARRRSWRAAGRGRASTARRCARCAWNRSRSPVPARTSCWCCTHAGTASTGTARSACSSRRCESIRSRGAPTAGRRSRPRRSGRCWDSGSSRGRSECGTCASC